MQLKEGASSNKKLKILKDKREMTFVISLMRLTLV